MQCYEYLATRRYARQYLGEWAGKLDDLELAEALDERGINGIEDIIERTGNARSATFSAARTTQRRRG